MELDNSYSRVLYSLFLKSIPKNYPGISHCSEVKDGRGNIKCLRIFQNGNEYRFSYTNMKPFASINDLKRLEDEMFKVLEGNENEEDYADTEQ